MSYVSSIINVQQLEATILNMSASERVVYYYLFSGFISNECVTSSINTWQTRQYRVKSCSKANDFNVVIVFKRHQCKRGFNRYISMPTHTHNLLYCNLVSGIHNPVSVLQIQFSRLLFMFVIGRVCGETRHLHTDHVILTMWYLSSVFSINLHS